MEEGLNHVDGQTSLCYWPWSFEVGQLLDGVKEAKKNKKFYFQLPHDTGPTQANMFDFKSKKMMRDVQDAPLSSLIFDLRLAHQIEDAKHKNQTTTLNKELSAFSQRPALID